MRNSLACLVAVLLGAVLFALSFPNFISAGGFPFFAWFALIPVFWLIARSSIKMCVFWGALYGLSAYSLFNYWLTTFHPLAGVIVGVVYLVYFAVLFPLLKAAVVMFPKHGYFLQWVLWMCFEYVRTLGFLGYSYGVIGYSQWNVLSVIQIADVFGVWGVSALVVFPSVWLAAGSWGTRLCPSPQQGLHLYVRRSIETMRTSSLLTRFFPFALWLATLVVTLVYGFIAQADYTDAKHVRVSMIQQNDDPWIGGIVQYRKNFEKLKRLSDTALAQKPDMVVWSETAFVPRIYWHKTYRDDEASWLLVKDLLDYLQSKDVPFVIGNDDARREPDKNPSVVEQYRVDYNGVLVFQKGEIVDQYRKVHLVPLTEYFPYRKQLPFVYNILEKADTHFWEKGDKLTVFNVNGVKFSTPICFEDTFGYLSREFTQNGAELIVNLTNDAWAKSLPAQMQHLSMAVFRSVENRRSMTRATASGQTCAIDPNGRILAMAEPFTEAQITTSVPLSSEISFYTRHGDWLPRVFLGAAAVLFVWGIVRKLWGKWRKTS
ncbi:MAG: apolipoprotein N-acyltransferase [Treponema sp.]|jgi:apolipoprotein N-acyltransferase|nr:apolipoprotein N-acyltransferase [Treponema sp.]